MFEDDSVRTYDVVRSATGAYSVWPAGRAMPAGWRPAGGRGDKQACLTEIAARWTDHLPARSPATDRPAADRTPWLLGRPPRQASAWLYCFAHSGGSVGEYLRWAPGLPGIGVFGLQLPGRAERLAEPPLTDVRALATAIVDEVAFRTPFVVLGHSFGALLAFEVSRELRRRGRPAPRGLVLSSFRPPETPRVPTRLHDLSDRELLAAIDDRYGGLPPRLWDEPELAELTLPAYRADFTALESYRYVAEDPLSIPLHAACGDRDTVTRDEMARWHVHTTGRFQLETFAGDHFYFRAGRTGLLRLIVRAAKEEAQWREEAQ